MLAQLSRNWWAIALRGIFAIIFGILAFMWPDTTLVVLVLFYGSYALVDGVFAVIAALTNHAGGRRGWILLEGLFGIGIGVFTFVWPGVTALSLLYLIAVWAIITGVMEILAAVQLRREITNEWMLILGGIVSVAFGILLIVFPGAGALSLIWLIAAYGIVFGVLLVGLSLRLRSWGRRAMSHQAG